MIVVDANTGLTVKVGDVFRNTWGTVKVLSIEPGLRTAFATFEVPFSSPGLDPDGMRYPESKRRKTIRVPLQVRWTHPSYPLRHVAFINS